MLLKFANKKAENLKRTDRMSVIQQEIVLSLTHNLVSQV